MKYSKEYKYKVGDIKEVKSGKIIITNQTITNNRLAYTYTCLECGWTDGIIREDHLLNNVGCACCSKGSNLLVKGYNDLATTHPWIIKWLVNKDDAYRYKFGMAKKINFRCINCGYEKTMRINSFIRQGFACNKCSDGISYPNKLIFNILEQLQLKFTCEECFDWAKDKKYDFSFILNDERYIIEAHGEQHYVETRRKGARSYKEEVENDRLKKELALSNCVNEDNYIVINCEKSEMKWIKDNILKSKLNMLFDLNKINWIESEKFALSSRIKEACDLWNSGKFNTTTEIGNTMKLKGQTIRKYLKRGNEIGLCVYDSQNELIKHNKIIAKKGNKKVICLNTKEVYESARDIENKLGISYKSISACCNDKQKSAGRDKNRNRLRWMFYEKYLKIEI